MRLLITSGRGPAECRVAVGVVLREMAREAQQTGLSLDRVDGPIQARDADPGSIVAILEGDHVDTFAHSWIGTIQYVWQSTIRPHHQRKNWFVSVSALSDPVVADSIDESRVVFETMRAGGPGGQHQNTTDSAVRCSYDGLTVVVREGRSQHQNKKIALKRIAQIMQTGAELKQAELLKEAQSRHDGLQRGNPVRVIRG